MLYLVVFISRYFYLLVRWCVQGSVHAMLDQTEHFVSQFSTNVTDTSVHS